MSTQVTEKAPLWKSLLTLCLFSIAVMALIATLYYETVYLIEQLNLFPDIIYFAKGTFYMLGGAIGFLGISMAAFIEIFQKLKTEKAGMFAMRLLIVGIIIMIVLPNLMHLSFSHFLDKKGYNSCYMTTTQIRFKPVIYTKSEAECTQLNQLYIKLRDSQNLESIIRSRNDL